MYIIFKNSLYLNPEIELYKYSKCRESRKNLYRGEYISASKQIDVSSYFMFSIDFVRRDKQITMERYTAQRYAPIAKIYYYLMDT